ncbi:MAG: F0F1 ATP synthase subunit gamma [Candidatus Omnitrophica bacterium]|nr:F0F1 ATP synthase subunit gamma [Candidatus Omnitrophota bacterium]
MRSQKQLRDELRFVTEFTTLFDVVQQSAAAQLRHLEERVGRQPALVERLRREFFPLLPSAAKGHALVRGGMGEMLLVVITSDEGLVGPLHTAVIQEALHRADAQTHWLFLGQRGWRIAGGPSQRTQVLPMPPEERAEEQLMRVRQFVLAEYRHRSLAQAQLIAPRYVSTVHQEVAVDQLLPLPVAAAEVDEVQLVIEPSLERVVERLAEAWVEALCREAFWSARRAECAARALHVEASRQQLNRQARAVRHACFKALHERLDVMVRETCVVQRHVARRAGRSPQLTVAR